MTPVFHSVDTLFSDTCTHNHYPILSLITVITPVINVDSEALIPSPVIMSDCMPLEMNVNLLIKFALIGKHSTGNLIGYLP